MSDPLQESLTLPCGARLLNRIVKSSMSEGLATPDNNPDARLFRLYETWSLSGAGTLFTGNVMVSRTHLDEPGNVVIDGAEDQRAIGLWAGAATRSGNSAWMQLNHSGRQTGDWCNESPRAPSAVRMEGFASPQELASNEIEEIIESFAHAAGVAQAEGFTGVEIHGAHGFLAAQFLSSATNRRIDEWGGSLENRARFLRRVIRAIRATVGGSFPIGVKFNSADFQRGGFEADECERVVGWLNEEGIDLLEISGGTNEPVSEAFQQMKSESTLAREAYFDRFAGTVRRIAEMPLMMTGGFRSRQGIERAIQDGRADLIGMARPLCIEIDGIARMFANETRHLDALEHRLAIETRNLPELKTAMPRFESSLVWYHYQIHVISQGQRPDRDLPMATGRDRNENNNLEWLARWRAEAAAGAEA